MRFAGLLFIAALCGGQISPSPEQAALDRISAASMRGNLSFLASDALEGRDTPSRGLTIAAEFIASRFRGVGLEEISGSYFQKAKFVRVTQSMAGFHMTLAANGEELVVPAGETSVRSLQAIDLKDEPVIDLPGEAGLPAIAGKVVAAESRKYGSDSELSKLRAAKPKLILIVSAQGHGDPSWQADATDAETPVIQVFEAAAAEALSDGRPMKISLHVAAPEREDTVLENVVGLLRGSDAALREQYIVVSAHYDHLGVKGGRIYHGANDNGSGVVSVIEIAKALASLAVHPKRSIVFAAFFGEEEGLLGSEYYVHHPPLPLSRTVANINLEQMGRTDEEDGRETGAFAFTGPSFSNLPSIMTAAARTQGVNVYNKRGADSFFDRSDNYAFAEAGIVAHTIVVAFEYPDYHEPGDQWEKIDYANMAKVDRGVAAGILEIADAPDAPKWKHR